MFLAAVAAVLCLAIPASAMAANSYTITSSFSPGKSGKTSKPTPVSGAFGFSVTDPEGKRPLRARRHQGRLLRHPHQHGGLPDLLGRRDRAGAERQGLQVVGAGRHRLREQHRRQRGQPRRRLDPLLPVDQALQLGQGQGRPVRQGRSERGASPAPSPSPRRSRSRSARSGRRQPVVLDPVEPEEPDPDAAQRARRDEAHARQEDRPQARPDRRLLRDDRRLQGRQARHHRDLRQRGCQRREAVDFRPLLVVPHLHARRNLCAARVSYLSLRVGSGVSPRPIAPP